MVMNFASRSGSSRGLLRKWLVSAGILLALLLLVPLLVIVIALRLPAELLEGPVLSLTRGQVRLTLPSGQIGSGKAELWVRDPANREWQPWMPIEWSLNTAWRQNGMVAEFSSNVGRVTVDHTGLTMNEIKVGLPPSLVLAGIAHPMANAPWRGDISLTSRRFACEWFGLRPHFSSCDGAATVRWRGMGSSILPLPEYGDYIVEISAQHMNGGRLRADVSTASGVVSINGFVEAKQGSGRYRLVVGSDQPLVVGLNSIVGDLATQRGKTGEYILDSGW